MNCREHQEFFSDLYDGNLPGDRRRDLESHLSACADCRAEYEVFSTSLHALREAAVPAPGDAFVRRVVDSARGESERQVLFQNTGMRRPTTRRTTAPRRAMWAVPALAASALIAFALGFMIQKHSADQRIQDLQDLLARNREVPQKTPVKKDPEPTADEHIAAFIKDQNIVKVNGVWMAADIRDRLGRDEILVDGVWRDRKKFVNEAVMAEMAKLAGAPDPKEIEAKVLEKYDLVRHGDWIIPRPWAAALESGKYLDSEGEPRDLAALVEEKIRDLGFVEHEGQQMRPEQRNELLANRRIHKGDSAPASAVTRALDGLEIHAPLGFRNLMLYPLTASGDRALAVATLAESIEKDRVEITDVDALQVRVRNKGDADIAVLAGEILIGGRHGRVVARDSIVPARKANVLVDVFDVEPAELRTNVNFRRETGSGHYWASLGMRRLLAEDAGQAGVWASMVSSGNRVSAAELYREHKQALLEFRAALIDLRTAYPSMTGVAVAVGDSIASLELFGTPALFAAHFDRVLESAAVEAIVHASRKTSSLSNLPAGPLSIRRLAENVFTAEHEVEGDSIVVRRNGRILGRALAPNGEAIRVLLFADAPPAPRPPVDLSIAPAKVQHVIKAYLAALTGPNGARRGSVLREMAMLPGPLALKEVLEQAKPGSPFRKDAVEAIGLRGDPAASATLLKWLQEEGRKENPGLVYSALAQALARIGSEEAIHVLISHIEPRSKEASRAAAEYLPYLMSSVRDPNTFATAIGNLISALNRLPVDAPDPQGAWQLKTLRQITGKSFVGTVDYQIWWNNPAERANFLEQRKR